MPFLVGEKISAIKARGGEGRTEGEGERGSWRRVVLAGEMAVAKA